MGHALRSPLAPLAKTIIFVLKGYPRLSETFIAQEIRALEQQGMDIRIVSLRHPTDREMHPVHREIRAAVDYLPEYLHQEPLRVWRGWRKARRLPGYRAGRAAWWRDLRRDPTRNRVRRFGQALVLAAELPAGVRHLHAHFLHTPTSVTRYAAIATGLPWTVSAHAKDIWTTPAWEVREKLDECRWLTTCTRVGADYLRSLAPRADIDLIYHGLDLARFPPPPARRSRRDGTAAENPVVLLSVGRAVAKKGYDVLLRALAALPQDLHWRFVHIGGGPLLGDLERQAEDLGIAEHIRWLGPQPQERVLEELGDADLFVLASRIDGTGDRDGLPNVLMEAQSQAVACIASRLSGVPELIVDRETGIMVPPEDSTALADAITALARDPEARMIMARAGEERLRRDFALETWIGRLAARFASEDRRARAAAD